VLLCCTSHTGCNCQAVAPLLLSARLDSIPHTTLYTSPSFFFVSSYPAFRTSKHTPPSQKCRAWWCCMVLHGAARLPRRPGMLRCCKGSEDEAACCLITCMTDAPQCSMVIQAYCVVYGTPCTCNLLAKFKAWYRRLNHTDPETACQTSITCTRGGEPTRQTQSNTALPMCTMCACQLQSHPAPTHYILQKIKPHSLRQPCANMPNSARHQQPPAP
jgi:hypothetical protein